MRFLFVRFSNARKRFRQIRSIKGKKTTLLYARLYRKSKVESDEEACLILIESRCRCCLSPFVTLHEASDKVLFCSPLCVETDRKSRELLKAKAEERRLLLEKRKAADSIPADTALPSAESGEEIQTADAKVSAHLSILESLYQFPTTALAWIVGKLGLGPFLLDILIKRQSKKKQFKFSDAGSGDLVGKGMMAQKIMNNMARAGSVASHRAHALRVTRLGVIAGGIATVKTFSLAILRRQGLRKAFTLSINTGVQKGGTHFITNTLAVQLGRSSLQHSLIGVSNSAARLLGAGSCSTIARAMGQRGLQGAAARSYAARLFRSNIVTGIAITMVLSYKDIKNMYTKEASIRQGVKNILLTAITIAGGMVGGIIGAALFADIPVLNEVLDGKVASILGFISGGIAGAILIGIVAKTTLSLFIHDDTKRMELEFDRLFCTFMEEYEVDETQGEEIVCRLMRMDAARIFADMFQHPHRRAYVASLLRPLFSEVLELRQVEDCPLTISEQDSSFVA